MIRPFEGQKSLLGDVPLEEVMVRKFEANARDALLRLKAEATFARTQKGIEMS